MATEVDVLKTPIRSRTFEPASLGFLLFPKHYKRTMADAPHGSKRLRTAEHELNDDDESIWVCSAEGQKIRWPRAAALCAGSLKDWIEDTGGEGAFGSGEMMAHNPPATFLKTLRDACAHDGDELGDRLHSLQFHETVGLLHAAHFLAATGVFAAAARHLCCTLLAGKGVDELRLILGATNDLSSSEQASALSELAFTLARSVSMTADSGLAASASAVGELIAPRPGAPWQPAWQGGLVRHLWGAAR